MASSEITDPPVSLLWDRWRAAHPPQPFSPRHAIEQRLQHGPGGFADGDHQDVLEPLQINSRRWQQGRDHPYQRVAFKLKVPVKRSFNAACIECGMKNVLRVMVQFVDFKSRGHLLLIPESPALVRSAKL